MGLVCPVGNNVKNSWNAIVNGESGITRLEDVEPGLHNTNVGGIVKDEKELLNSVFTPAKQRKTGRFIQLAVLAAAEAMKDAGIDREIPLERRKFGSYIGVGIGGLEVVGEGVEVMKNRGQRALSPFLIPRAIISEAPGWLSMEWNLQGPTVGICNACASGTDAIGLAYQAIKSGSADYMMAGGSEAVATSLGIGAFGNMRVLSNWQGEAAESSRPFAKDRCGFVMAEGAGVLILERKDLAEKRGAKIYGEVVGYGAAADAFHLTSMHPEGRGGVAAIKNAIEDAKISPEKINYINAHGTATMMNDPSETKILKKVFGNSIDKNNPNRTLVSSTKSMTGHMLGGTGAVEAIFSVLALNNQVVPPTINLHQPDEECDLDFVPNVARDKKLEYALSNSFGFGGGNSALVFKKV